MRLTVKAPFLPDEHAQVQVPAGVTLGQLLGDQAQHVTSCQVQGQFREAWQDYVPQQHDTVVLFVQPHYGVDIATAIAYAVISFAVSTALSFALQAVIRALSPTPSRSEGKVEQIYGIAGLTNTTAQGTPKLLCYGTRRVYGHILSTRCGVIAGGKAMSFGVLYFMGEGPIHQMTQVQINDVDSTQYPGVNVFARLGGDDNAELIHPDFLNLSQVWSDGRQLPLNTSIVYQTRSTKAERCVLILYSPFLQGEGGGGASHTISIETTTVADNSYTPYGSPITWTDTSLSPRFLSIDVQLPSGNQWLIRLTCTSTSNAQQATPTLFNIMEEQTGDQTYPHSALLAITGIASSQIPSFESLRGSALVQGRLVDQPDTEDPEAWDGMTFITGWTQERAWILRDILTNERVGLGHRIPAGMFDDRAALEVQAYWNTETTDGSDIPRDICNLLINDRRPAWDWLKLVTSEARAILAPSQGKLKLLVDKANIPGLTYSRPGNIIEGSEQFQLGSGQGLLPNSLLLQFPDQDDNYNPHILRYRMPGTESEPEREAPAVTVYSLTTWPHAWWAARFELLRQRLVQRHVQWSSPLTAMVSEPFDHVAFASETADYTYGASGFLNEDSTVSRLVLDRSVYLADAQTYTVMVRHQATNSVETRTVTNTVGTWGAITLSSALDTAPVSGDLWALGVLDSSLLHLVINDVQQDGEQGYRLLASLYEPQLYAYPEVPTSPIPPAPGSGDSGSGGGPPPPPPPDSNTLPAPVLTGAFGSSGVVTLDWTLPELVFPDFVDDAEVWLRPDNSETYERVAFGDGIDGHNHFQQVTAELFLGTYKVRYHTTAQGWSPYSNEVPIVWQQQGGA